MPMLGPWIVVLLCSAAMTGQEEAPVTSQPAISITRRDLAAAYLEFKARYAEHPPEPDRLAGLNRGFDEAANRFLRGDFTGVLQRLHELAASLGPGDSNSIAARIARSLKVRITPPVYVVGSSPSPFAVIDSMYPVEADDATDIRYEIRLAPPDGKPQCALPFVLRAAPSTTVNMRIPITSPPEGWALGTYALDLVDSAGHSLSLGSWFVVASSLDQLRKSNERKLAEVKTNTPKLEQAVAAARTRNGLLADEPSEFDSAEFLADMAGLAREVNDEVAAVAAGRDPYERRLGRYWRTFRCVGSDVPTGVYAPAAAAGPDPIPLVVALHGTGGDENMFLYSHGAGALCRLADAHGFLVATPLTYLFVVNPSLLDCLIAALAYDYPIDLNRIYVVGHSLGGIATEMLAEKRHATITAACCLASPGRFKSDKPICPILVVAGELDRLFQAEAIQRNVALAGTAGLPIEFRRVPGCGHALLPDVVLPDVIQWLLSHPRGDGSPENPSTRPANEKP